MQSFYKRNEFGIAIFAMVIVFLALIRTLAEPLRLHYLNSSLDYAVLKPLINGALIASTALFVMGMFAFYKKYTAINMVGVLTIVILLIVKGIFTIG